MIALLASIAFAASPGEEAQRAQLDALRADVAGQVQLASYDLVDEVVYGMTTEPPFETPTPVVLAGVTVPVGLGAGLQALVENHLADVLTKNPTTNVQLVHCPTCTQVVVHSGPEGTIVSRGVDNPAVLEELGGAGKHALFLDIEAEGAFLVLRARLTGLSPDLPIVWSRTLSTSASTPSLLRQGDRLKSASDARQEYIDAIEGRGNLAVPLRVGVRSYAGPPWWDDQGGNPPPPFVWLQSGIELAPTSAKVWTSEIVAGYSFVPMAYQGIMAQARVKRILTGRARSLTRPDLYGFFGISAQSVWGPATASFTTENLTADQIIAAANEEGPRNIFGTMHLGVELRVGNRIGGALFLEALPAFQNSRLLGNYVRVAGLDVQSFGAEVTFWF
jgi:hypothetical protein